MLRYALISTPLPCPAAPPSPPAAIFVDNHAMAAYREVARYASFLFLMMQILLLIDFGYRTNEWLIEVRVSTDLNAFATQPHARTVAAHIG